MLEQLSEKSQQLVRDYTDAVSQQLSDQEAKREQFLDDQKKQFKEHCHIWLGDLWDDFKPDMVEANYYNNDSIIVNLPVSFLGMFGALHQRSIHYPSGKPKGDAELSIKFGTYLSVLKAQDANLKLPGDFIENKYQPQSVDQGQMAKYLALLITAAEEIERVELQQAEQDNLRLVSNIRYSVKYATTVEELGDWLGNANEVLPDLSDEWYDKASAQLELIQKRELEAAQRAATEAALENEKARLELQVESIWKQGFEIFMVRHGAYVSGDDKIVDEFTSLQDAPDADGYWPALLAGVQSRRIRPVNIISVERILIDAEAEAPYEAKRWVEIKSDRIAGFSISAVLPPIEVIIVPALEPATPIE